MKASKDLVPAFDWHSAFVQPWAESFEVAFWIVLMGAFVTAACGLVGNFLLLRRMALMGDAISHSILPGLVVAFLIFKNSFTWVMFGGALIAGLATVALVEFIHSQSRVKPDAAICITFTTLFALGVALMSAMEDKGNFHIDAECLLYGEIAYVALEPPVVWLGWKLCPPSVLRMAVVLLVICIAAIVFYKELLLTSFDMRFAQSLGMKTGMWDYGLMGSLALVIVSAFEAVGAILPIAMLILPAMFAGQISSRLPVRFGLTFLHAFLSAFLGFHLSVWLNCSAAGAMAVAGSLLFVLAWLATSFSRLMLKFFQQNFLFSSF